MAKPSVTAQATNTLAQKRLPSTRLFVIKVVTWQIFCRRVKKEV
jgi:hypothetical protein